jgi:hypothetical protein
MWEHFCLTGRIIGNKNFNILMTHLKADVAEVFFSYYSACEAKICHINL